MASFAGYLIKRGVGVLGSALEVRGTGGPAPQTPLGLIALNLPPQELAGRVVRPRPASCGSQGSRTALGSLPSVALSSAGAKVLFPVSVTLGGYRVGNGKRHLELIASGVTCDFSPG